MPSRSPKLLSRTYKNLLGFYQAKLKRHGLNDPQALSYNSRSTQEARFAQFLKLIPQNESATVLDVGCGLGDFAGYLHRHGYTHVRYTGIDIVPEMITGAGKKHPDQIFIFICADLFTAEIQPHDYVVSSGALNIIFSATEEQEQHIDLAIAKMWTLAKKGLAFNLLNIHSKDDFEQDSLFFYSNPAHVLEYCRKITKKTQLVDNYLDYDFTICMEKT